MCNGRKPSVQPKPPYTPPRRRREHGSRFRRRQRGCRLRCPVHSRDAAAAHRLPKALADRPAGRKIWLSKPTRVISDETSLQVGGHAHKLEQPAGLLVKPVTPIALDVVMAD